MIFVDSNVPMYLVGSPHPNKERADAAIARLKGDSEEFVTDVEVYQEIIHRYSALGRLNFIDKAFSALDELVYNVLSFGMPEIHEARDLIHSVNGISARDALHAAVMRHNGISRILSYDRGFDSIPDIERLE